MGDSTKTKSKNNPRSSSLGSNKNNASSLGNRDFSPRADLEAQILASSSPIASAMDACSWLEKKGWSLSSESYSKNKLSDILFSAALAFNPPPEVDSAIRSVAYLIRDLAEEGLASSVSDKVAEKIVNTLSETINKLSDSVTSAKNFLDATSQQQATELLSLQETSKQHSDLIKSLADSSEKLNQVSNSRNLTDSAWPLLSAVNQSPSQLVHPVLLLHSHNTSHTTPKVLQWVSLASKQLLIEYGPLEENENPREKSVEAQRELRQLFNDWIDDYTIMTEGEDPPPPHLVRYEVSPSSIDQLCSSNLSPQPPKIVLLTFALTMHTS